MLGLETFHIIFIAVLLAVALIVRFFMNRAMDEARKNGIVDSDFSVLNTISYSDFSVPNTISYSDFSDPSNRDRYS